MSIGKVYKMPALPTPDANDARLYPNPTLTIGCDLAVHTTDSFQRMLKYRYSRWL